MLYIVSINCAEYGWANRKTSFDDFGRAHRVAQVEVDLTLHQCAAIILFDERARARHRSFEAMARRRTVEGLQRIADERGGVGAAIGKVSTTA